ncbi:Coenzyme F420-dependent N5,N10-methylene tetrahydromethanopterin reductase [Serinicoccus hydrothermalis]|uniref:Coenzyme F420-dependent N5,N10-methylene tetrahydromethanopterin reductase n=1 Tax=Serinicoccus hydrothermalis TaxID=1758689 RepID=A0A1B1NEX6_9MICO|nr:LLM class flavin-dependent oxidoreductase [Serinicoccus hydrothermalis]ANS79915.1 Coenzyme F420-dependent N5,N10-methylene tetrahydromethanopterin reductase [Serinicoccus hydrothermalis]
MRIGVCILPEYPWREAEPLWRQVEDWGFEHAWTYDHLVWAGLPQAPWHSTVATLAAAAVVTERVRLGTFVASPNFRHPALLAKDVTTLDDLSAGRVLLGLGAGGDLDSRLLGARHTRGERTARFEEFVPLLDRLLTEDDVEVEGEFFTVGGAGARPRCVQQPRVPFVVAANGPRSMRLAVAHGAGWLTTGPPGAAEDGLDAWWRGVRELSARVEELEAETGRARPLDRYLSLDAGSPALGSLDEVQDRIGRAQEAGFTDVVVHWPRPDPPYQADVRVLEQLAASRS